ncbi:GDSL family lipase [Anaerobacillus alkaliphilus]|uniref:GDSL family lipase n=1 Tax=Anaerobacillus alkaliphilus TaxID=1548597 RepID=A0A4Q0VUN3_9BACI|nr:SGNH/GDSL hydrolase family protein [Anaerobacillus alkaliphilus]RXJ02087.1 GDSL family lipase [Anaerobacillus alkaliphilus]
MKLKEGQTLLFIGDSITDCDRAKPHGEGLFGAYGNGYVSLVQAFLQATYPNLRIRVVNKGISGNTVRDLKNRWQEDVLAYKPEWLSVMIGINDVWRQFDVPHIKEKHVYLDEYKETLRILVQETRPLVEGMVLMTPYFIENNEQDPMRQMMDQYGDIVKQISDEFNCIFVNTQAVFNKILGDLHSSALAWDRVHPTPTGHMLLAREFLTEIGFDWSK